MRATSVWNFELPRAPSATETRAIVALSGASTTLTLVVTNQQLDRRELNKPARQTHASLARAIHPFHALVDGDVLYAVTTNEVASPQLESIGRGIVASELAWDAVLTSFDPGGTAATRG